jgi:hypothetical protein
VALLLRRFLVLVALMFWLGGFTFYASIVVPVGQKLLGPGQQGLVTTKVTNYLNLSGAIALAILAWDLAALKNGQGRRRFLWLCWVAMVLTLGLLVYFHQVLVDMMPHRPGSLDAGSFRTMHSMYLWTSTVQWVCGVAYVVLTLAAWRSEDRRNHPGSASAST